MTFGGGTGAGQRIAAHEGEAPSNVPLKVHLRVPLPDMRKLGAHVNIQVVPAPYRPPRAGTVSHSRIASCTEGSEGHVMRSQVPGYWLTGREVVAEEEVAGDVAHIHSPVAEQDTPDAGELREKPYSHVTVH